MKFGKQLEELMRPKFKGYYISYKELKKVIKVWTGVEKNQSTVQEVTHWTSSFLRLGPNPETTTEARLLQVINKELDRVSKYAELESAALRSQFEQLEEACVKGTAEDASAKLTDLIEQVAHLKEFEQLNYTGFRKILKKYDKFCKTQVSPWLLAKVAQAPLVTIDYDSFLLIASRIAALLRGEASSMQAPGEGAAHKEFIFWVTPDDSLSVKMQLATTHTLLAATTSQLATENRAGAQIKSVFLDTSSLAVYQQHMPHCVGGSVTKQAASSTRHFRLHDGDTVTLVEEHGEQNRMEALVSRADVKKALSGEMDTALETSSGKSALVALHRAVREDGLRPMAQASFVRYTFCDSKDSITATLDERVRFRCQKDSWDAPADDLDEMLLSKDVLTIRVPPGASKADLPSWFQALSNTVELNQVPNFTKAAHAVARFHSQDLCLPTPHWYNSVLKAEMADVNSDISGEHPSQTNAESKPMEQDSGVAEGRKLSASKVDAKQPKRSRIDSVDSLIHEGHTRHEFEAYTKDEVVLEEIIEEPITAQPTGGNTSSLKNNLCEPLLGTGSREERDVQTKAKVASGPGFFSSIGQRLSSAKAKFAGLGKGDGRTPAEGSAEAKVAKPVRSGIITVQPKTLFANERTFLEWIHFATMFSAIGVVALHTHGSETGLVAFGRGVVLASVCLIAWALRTFSWRVEALNAKKLREYHDPIGPPALMICLILALVAASFQAVFVREISNTVA